MTVETGIVWAYPRNLDRATLNLAPYIFRCSCAIGRARRDTGIPLWNGTAAMRFIIEGVVETKKFPLTIEHLIELIEKKRTNTPEFEEYITVYGRQNIVRIWNDLKIVGRQAVIDRGLI